MGGEELGALQLLLLPAGRDEPLQSEREEMRVQGLLTFNWTEVLPF